MCYLYSCHFSGKSGNLDKSGNKKTVREKENSLRSEGSHVIFLLKESIFTAIINVIFA